MEKKNKKKRSNSLMEPNNEMKTGDSKPPLCTGAMNTTGQNIKKICSSLIEKEKTNAVK